MPSSVCVMTRTLWPCSQNTSTCGSALMMASAVSRLRRSSAISSTALLLVPARRLSRRHSMAPASAAAPAAMLSTRMVRGFRPASGIDPPSATATTRAATTTRLARRSTASSPRGLPELPLASACHINADQIGPPAIRRKRETPANPRETAGPPINESLTIMGSMTLPGHSKQGTPAQGLGRCAAAPLSIRPAWFF